MSTGTEDIEVIDAAALRDLILRGDAAGVTAALAPLAEKHRRGLSKSVWELHRAIERGEPVEPPEGSSLWKRARGKLIGPPMEVRSAVQLAMLGVCPVSRLRQLRFWFFRDDKEDLLVKVLADRRPQWLRSWLDEVFESRDGPPMHWSAARRLALEGLCDRPTSSAYIQLMADQMVDWAPQHSGLEPLHRRLSAMPDVLEHEVWRLFEVDLGARTWHPPGVAQGWSDALCRLAQDGQLDRRRLLDASLDSLSSGLAPSTLSSLRRLHKALRPEIDEIAERQAGYLALLGSRVGHVAGLGLEMLGRLERADRLDRDAFIDAVAPVLELPAKAQPARALKLLERVSSHAPRGRSLATPMAAVARALAHPSPDIQAQATALLERFAVAGGATGSTEPADGAMLVAREAIARALPSLAPPLAQRLAKLAGLDVAASDDEDSVAAEDLRILYERWRALDPSMRRQAGLETWPLADGADDKEPLPPPWQPAAGDIRVLAHVRPIEPIADWEELVDAAAHAVEVVDSADELERLLAGLARHGAERPSRFGRRTEAMARRLDTHQGSFTARGLGGSLSGTPGALLDLLRTWVQGRVVTTRSMWPMATLGPFPFLVRRLQEIARRIVGGRRDPLLAAPTHAGGWIEPAVLIERAKLLSGREPDPADLVQALLRLTPDGRAGALAPAAAIDGRLGALLRFALGGEESPPASDWRHAALWLAAARARQPTDHLAERLGPLAKTVPGKATLAALGKGPDGLRPARYTWRPTTVTQRGFWETKGEWPHVDLRVDGQPPPQAERPAAIAWQPLHRQLLAALQRRLRRLVLPFEELPTTALHRLAAGPWHSFDQQTPWQVAWAASVWPQNTEAVLAAGAHWMVRRLDEAAAATAPNHAYLEPLLDPDRPWTEMAYLAASLALLSRDKDARGVVVDALIEGIDDGRVHPQPLGSTWVRLWSGGWAKANRLAGGLDDVARVGPLHQWIVARSLDTLVASWPSPPHGAHLVFQLLADGLSTIGETPSDGARSALETVTGKGKTARLAQALLDLEPEPAAPARRAALAHAIESRLERAEG